MKNSIEIEVRPTEIDVMGHVNNAKYLEYLEWSREIWYNRANLPFDKLTSLGIGTVTVHIAISYRKEARLGEKLTVYTEPLRRGRSSFVFYQTIYNEKGELVTEAEVTSCTIDLKTRKSTPIPAGLASYFPPIPKK